MKPLTRPTETHTAEQTRVSRTKENLTSLNRERGGGRCIKFSHQGKVVAQKQEVPN